MEIIYIDSGNNFEVFLAIAAKSTSQWTFVVFDKRKADICAKKGFSFCLMPSILDSMDKKNTRRVAEILGRWEIDFACTRDRVLRFLPKSLGRRWLMTQSSTFYELLERVRPDLILGEVSCGNEYLFALLSERRDVPYRHLLNLPGDRNRAVLFDREHSYSSLAENPKVDVFSGTDLSYNDLSYAVKKSNFGAKKFSFFRSIKNLFDSSQLRDHRRLSAYYKLYGVCLIFNAFFQRLVYSIFGIESALQIHSPLRDRKIILFAWHIQPESTPDFLTTGSVDQERLAIAIGSAVPNDFVLAIKDHPNKTSVRSLLSLIRLALMKRVILLKPSLKLDQIWEHVACVISIGGTITKEALENDRTAIVLSNIFYGKYEGVKRFTNIPEVILFLQQRQLTVSSVHEKSSRTLENFDFGVKAVIHDPQIVPQVLDARNIEALSELIDLYLRDRLARCPVPASDGSDRD